MTDMYKDIGEMKDAYSIVCSGGKRGWEMQPLQNVTGLFLMGEMETKFSSIESSWEHFEYLITEYDAAI